MYTFEYSHEIGRSQPIFHDINRSTKVSSKTATAPRKRHHRRASATTVLSANDINRAAALLFEKFGESAIAGAMFHAHEAELRGALVEMTNWRRIAESALHRLDA
jgi:hypothetical protein